MARTKSEHLTDQLSVRSPFARARASRLAKLTGMTITQVVEDALRAYQPMSAGPCAEGLIDKDGLLVLARGRAPVTQAQVDRGVGRHSIQRALMAKLLALLDSNVVIASIAEGHEHHEPSIALLQRLPAQRFGVAAHSYAEAYSILTRRSSNSPFAYLPELAISALESMAARCVLLGLTHAQTFDAIRDFASDKGIGPRLYDKLIGQTAVLNGLDTVITWNLAHMRGLFPSLAVVSPITFKPG